MTLPVVLSREAREDVGSAARWYRDRNPEAARAFLLAVGRCLESLERYPHAHPRLHRSFRRALLRRHPFMLVYVLERERVYVIGCFHLRRDPQRWRTRLDE